MAAASYVDGIKLSDDLTGVVALGISTDGRKMLLDFEIGASESAGVCDLLMARLVQRDLAFAGPPLAVLDGSKALRASVVRHFPQAHVQRCLVHKERNIRATLSRKWHGRPSGLFNRLRAVQGLDAAVDVVAELRAFLAAHSRKAMDSLDEAGDDLLALHRLGCPSTLNVSLLSTNSIENPFRNARARIGRVKRWRAETDQAERWLAYGLVEAQKGFRRIKGYRDIGLLLQAMNWPPDVCQASLRSAWPWGREQSDLPTSPGRRLALSQRWNAMTTSQGRPPESFSNYRDIPLISQRAARGSQKLDFPLPFFQDTEATSKARHGLTLTG